MNKKQELIPSKAMQATIDRSQALSAPAKEGQDIVSLKIEIQLLRELLDSALQSGSDGRTIATLIDLKGKIELIESKMSSETHPRFDVFDTATRLAEIVSELNSDFDSEGFIEFAKVQLEYGSDSSTENESVLRDLQILRRTLEIETDPVVTCRLILSVSHAINVALELGRKSKVFLSQSQVVKHIENFVQNLAQFFPDDIDDEARDVQIDRACQIMGEELRE